MTCCKKNHKKKHRYDEDGIILHDDESEMVEGLSFKIFDTRIDIPSPDEIRDKLAQPFNEIGDKITGPFNGIKQKFEDIGNGLRDIFDGIGDIFNSIFQGIGDGFNDIGLLFRYFGIFLQTHLYCGIKFIRNFTHCAIYYIIDAFLRTLYLPFTIAFWVSKNIFKLDMSYVEDEIWDNLWKIDGYVFSTFSVHILMWPLNVRNDCYNCTRMKVSAMKRVAEEIDQDFRNIGKGIKNAKGKIKQGGDEIKSVFTTPLF